MCGHRSPLGGRNFEAFSEDPYLSGSLASAYVRGLQSERVAATVKHYVGNEQDTRRFVVNETISERALREIYLRPFEKVVKESSPWAFMSSYPKINGKHVDASPKFIEEILRGQWQYDGLVMSDWGAASCVDSVRYGYVAIKRIMSETDFVAAWIWKCPVLHSDVLQKMYALLSRVAQSP